MFIFNRNLCVRLYEADKGGCTGGIDCGTDTTNVYFTKGLDNQKSFNDVLKNKEYQSEFDKRIAKALETSRRKWESEFNTKLEMTKKEAEKLAKINADEKLKYADGNKGKELSDKKENIHTRELRGIANETLVEKGILKELAYILNYPNSDTCNQTIGLVEMVFQEILEKVINQKFKDVSKPKTSDANIVRCRVVYYL